MSYRFPVQSFPINKRDLFPIRESALDLALSAFDDQYKGCVDMMETELAELNRTEFANNSVYAEAWEQAASKWREQRAFLPMPKGLKPEYAIAILAYTIQGSLHKDFNAAVREAGRTRESYLNNFNFKTLHFLLTKALQVLRSQGTRRCHKVYRGVKGIRFTSESRKPIRFGQFTSSSLKNTSALQFGQDTFFSIETCYGVSIRNFSFFPGEEEVLIPPFEMFKVTNFTKARDKTLIQLRSLEESSNYNCVFVKGKSLESVGWVASWSLGGSSLL
uniref:NAD(P)(+)--arginine ADP-ribosyltransferase n=1 Tax=Sphenodon punctatus TaxID=8508 RepID=A0A8D0HQ40_SPHPU